MAIEYVRSSFDDYLSYLEGVKHELPEEVYAFASDPARHDLSSPGSLHDSWLISLEVSESRQPEQPFKPSTSVTLKLLGQMHDRELVIRYIGVEQYSLEGAINASRDTNHGDLLRHEIKAVGSGSIAHDIEFSEGSFFRVICSDLRVSDIIYT